MMKLIQGRDAGNHANLFDQMYRLRARVFHDRLKWDVRVTDGWEKDEFDDLDPLYGLALTDDGTHVLGCFRLLQTTGPTMLGSVFRELLPDDMAIRSPVVWESTRFCVDTDAVVASGVHGVNKVTATLLSSLYEVGAWAGLSHIVTVIDVRMERVLRRAGCPMERLSPPRRIGRVDTLAILMPTSEESVSAVRDHNKLDGPRMSFEQMATLAA